MKRGIFLLLAVAVGSSVMFFYQASVVQAITKEVEENTDLVIADYNRIVRENVMPLKNDKKVPSSLLKEVNSILKTHNKMMSAKTIREKAHGINKLQIALHDFVLNMEKSKKGRKTLKKNDIKDEVGENGPVRAKLQSYNEAVKRWNSMIDGKTSSFVANISGKVKSDNMEKLPILRFDGKKEEKTTIEL